MPSRWILSFDPVYRGEYSTVRISARKVSDMKFVTLLAALLASGCAFAQPNATALKFANGKIILAQSYCGMCDSQRTECVLRCNGAGGCIQNCDNDFLLCRERSCQFRR